jgi:glycosyltransferase involved in cell wall biosynthesis
MNLNHVRAKHTLREASYRNFANAQGGQVIMLTSEHNARVQDCVGMHDNDRENRLLIFAPWCYGHHPTYLRHLINHWCQSQLKGNLDIVVLPSFLHKHEDVVKLAQKSKTIRFVATTLEEQSALESATSNVARAFQQYQLISKYAKQLQATQGLVLYFDSCLLPLVLGAKFPCPFSGIYYRPTLHYSSFPNYTPSWKERIQAWKERVFLFRIQRNPSVKALLSLDPFAVKSIEKLGGKTNVVHLPDPAPGGYAADHSVENLKQRLGIDSSRKVFLCFGRLSEGRKGIPQLVDAISTLPTALCQKLCLLFAGEPQGAGNERLETWLAPIRELQSVQIVNCSGYIPESAVPIYFQLADVVLAPYQKHVGMSGILLQAAAAGKPVLSSDYGLMGEMVRRYQLGLAVDSTQVNELAKGITVLLSQPLETIGDRTQMQMLIEQNSVEQFANTIFQTLLARSEASE